MPETILILAGDTMAPSERQLQIIRETAPGHTILSAESLNEAHRKDPEALRRTAILFGHCPQELLEQAPGLRWIQQFSAGADWIHRRPGAQALLKQRGITVTKASGVHAACIAEHAMGFILCFARRLDSAIRNQQTGQWLRGRPDDFFELEGRTAVLVGVGAIGSRFARYASAFGVHIIGIRRDPTRQDPHVERMLPPDRLHEVLPGADFLVLIAPGTPETKAMIGKEEFALLKEGAVLVNVGRGSVVDEEAMIDALRKGRVACAGLDVFEKEPLPEDSPLWSMENVIITPHHSGLTPRYLDHLFPIFHENLKRYLAGEPLFNVVDIDIGY